MFSSRSCGPDPVTVTIALTGFVRLASLGSVNVPAATLVDAQAKTFLPPEEVAPKFAAHGVTRDKRVVAYCGGGISATIDLFQLHRLGYDDITLYDGSMGEWAKDATLPIETG